MTATTDRAALYAGILERPEDDVARLVYADWLEENGEAVPCPVCPPDEGEEPHPADIVCDRCHGARTVGDGQRERAEFIRDCIWMNANHTDCPVRLGDVKRGRPVPLRCGSCEYCTARRRAERFYAKHIWLPGVNYAVSFDPSPLDGPMPTGPGLTLSVSRGFVSTVHTTLQSWVGGPCGCAAGRETNLRQAFISLACPCSGTGRTPALGPRIVAEQPVERVEVVGREPSDGSATRWDNFESTDGFGWFSAKPYPTEIDEAEDLPEEIWDELVDQKMIVGGWKIYPTEAAAQSALSLALINWARREAGLPPLRSVELATA